MEAKVSRVHFEENSLERLILTSSNILLVSKAASFSTNTMMSILPKGSQYEGKNNEPFYEPPYSDYDASPQLDKNYPPFRVNEHHFKVVSVLKNSSENLHENNEITVVEAHTGAQLSLHRRYYMEGIRKSPIYSSYKPSIDIDSLSSHDIFIIFIDEYENIYQYSAINAYERLELKDEIMKRISDSNH